MTSCNLEIEYLEKLKNNEMTIEEIYFDIDKKINKLKSLMNNLEMIERRISKYIPEEKMETFKTKIKSKKITKKEMSEMLSILLSDETLHSIWENNISMNDIIDNVLPITDRENWVEFYDSVYKEVNEKIGERLFPVIF